MNIDKFKQQHEEIIGSVTALRQLAKKGILEHAAEIAQQIVSMSSIIKLHLAVEDTLLYPALRDANNPLMAIMSKKFQEEMDVIASAYMHFSRNWNSAAKVADGPERFRSEANIVLKTLYERMQRENTIFYPAIEAL